MNNELDLIARLKALCPINESVILGIDDDTAILKATTNATLVCADMLMEGTHFLLESASPREIGHKSLAVNLSDIAAMGGRALSAFVSLALPRAQANSTFIEELYAGMGALARSFEVAIAGGDTNIWNGPLVINVTVLGECHTKGAIKRSGAKVGDTIFVTGPLGGSLEGHHLNFVPRLRETKDLMDAFAIHSMIDISDGLAKDLREIARQSGVAAHLDRSSIPARLSKAGNALPLENVLCDGEDFELCFTVNAADSLRLKADSRFAYCRDIGKIEQGDGLYWSGPAREPIAWRGFEHGAQK